MVQLKNLMLYNSQSVHMRPASEILAEDWTSIQGQFGWIELSNTMMPYLTRSGQKYVSLRMVKSKIFVKYHQLFTDEIRNCYRVQKLKITKAEAALLNEINFRHCDNSFGRIEFTTNDEIATLDDIRQMDEFLDFCKTKLVEKNVNTKQKKCGFIRIASENCVPYVWYEDSRYVPLFYFEGECKYLEEKARDLRGWELAYLKLVCKIQGIRKALFDHDSVQVVQMELVEKFFPSNTLFEMIWLLGTNLNFLVKSATLRSKIVSIKGPSDKKYKPANSRNVSEKKFNAKVAKSAPVAQTNPTTCQNGLEPSPMALATNESHPQQNICLNQYTNLASSSSFQLGTELQRASPDGNYVINPIYPVASSAMAYKQTPTLRAVSAPNSTRSNVLQIPDHICNSTNDIPYFLVRSRIENKELDCFNMDPYSSVTLLVTLEEAATSLEVALDTLVNAVNVMRLDIFLPNKLQIRYLERNNKYPTAGLLKFKDFEDNFAHIRYILSS